MAQMDGGERTVRAAQVIDRLSASGMGVITPQVVSEFVSVCLKRKYLNRRTALAWAGVFLGSFECMPLNDETARTALVGCGEHGMSIYDAQLWASAKVHGIPTIVTEDLPGGRTEIDGVRYINPFARSFTFAKLGI
jgi:predicted nucleic acid-binding protein